MMPCLEALLDREELQGPCNAWMTGRRACEVAFHRRLCDTSMVECLPNVPAIDLDPECRNSRFYNTLKVQIHKANLEGRPKKVETPIQKWN